MSQKTATQACCVSAALRINHLRVRKFSAEKCGTAGLDFDDYLQLKGSARHWPVVHAEPS
jgi:hypothetical protein